ncbi:uncharacterized protein MELLADRAFT_85907 [Melampsora larici-populina 98AG31]|uniref:Uncharacterized protein n=1 Tax=Melampsora larici-populina (strain 98AG31 / pathotype 3-4-7) TaxID=747676 RepID=F4RK34_MELLP|nr:uncharacterized protein MELLADRAFT_85907 [Melampsora larici-populina 98AG31]EGG07255.1 hypothetical protein MELLADRAFT_85907 [Melampsora larici-populina 98AG31]
MSDNSNPTYHGIYLSGNFEIEQKLSPNHGWRSEYRTYVTYIGCGGADRDQRLLYEIKAKGYSSPTYMLSQDYIYYLRGSFFPSNNPETENDQLLFEGSDANVVSACKSCEVDLVDSVGVTSLGIVIGIDTIVEKCRQLVTTPAVEGGIRTTVLTVQHADYHPILKSRRVSKMEYLVRPTRALAGNIDSIIVGKECQIHGYIKDYNQDTACYVVIVNKIHLTTGFQEQQSAPTATLDPVTEKAALESEGEAAGVRNDDSQLPPSPGPSASLSSASDNSGMPKEAVIAEVKKRARYQPKRKLSTASGDVSP